MSDRAFLSFHYERDAARALQVSDSKVAGSDLEWAGLASRPDWLALERRGPQAIQQWLDGELASASVTVVLIGGETCASRWVHYAIRQSRAEGMGMLGIHIHRLTDPRTGLCDYRGQSPFELTYVNDSNPLTYLSELYPTYDWVGDDGPTNLVKWIASARAWAGRQTLSKRA